MRVRAQTRGSLNSHGREWEIEQVKTLRERIRIDVSLQTSLRVWRFCWGARARASERAEWQSRGIPREEWVGGNKTASYAVRRLTSSKTEEKD